MTTLFEFLGAEPADDGCWRFAIPRELHGAFGGAFGGVVCAATLVAARSLHPGRAPNALDCRFVRGLPAGDAFANATTIQAGRSLANVSVDLTDADGRLCARSTISLAQPELLEHVELDPAEAPSFRAHADADAWPAVAPIVETIDPRFVGRSDGTFATAIVVPWEITGDSSAEAVCMAADLAVGPPLGANMPPGVGTPNPDISVRFCGEVATQTVVGASRLMRASDGIAAIDVHVWSGDALVGTAISTALLLPPR
jgi:acyl-coenzyme A thioesterase PaaI-like protein